MLTIKKTNKALASHFGENQIELVKGHGYFYFSGKLAEQMNSTGIYINSLKFLTAAQIIRAAIIKIEQGK